MWRHWVVMSWRNAVYGNFFAWIKKKIIYISGQRDDRSIGANDVVERVYLFIQ